MSFVLLTAALVETLHDAALNPGEIPGRAPDKSLEAALARVENRVVYDMIEDVFDLAANYAESIARGHCFNDGNKRTAFDAMNFCLWANGTTLSIPGTEIGDRIIALARGDMDAESFAAYLRTLATA